VSFLHTKLRYAHLNLSLSSIFLDHLTHLKIGGLSSARSFDQLKLKHLLKLKADSLELYYLAPEVLNPVPSPQGFLNSDRIDIFALGVILFILLFKNTPFSKASLTDDPFYKKLCQGFEKGNDIYFRTHPSTRKVKVSPEIKNLLSSMLQSDPIKRPNIHQLLQNKWVNNQS